MDVISSAFFACSTFSFIPSRDKCTIIFFPFIYYRPSIDKSNIAVNCAVVVCLQPPSMRNSMLTVLGKLVMNLLTGDNLDQNHKNMRGEFLDTLCEHLHDCNGFVRAKVSLHPQTNSK